MSSRFDAPSSGGVELAADALDTVRPDLASLARAPRAAGER
jgi:hypothetical protein